MTAKSSIEWTRTIHPDGTSIDGTTWSPATGCTKVSAGCKYCYAEREVEARWSKNPLSRFYGRSFSDVRCHSDLLRQPLAMRQARRIFVCPRGDLFHPKVSFEFVAAVFGAMALARQHTFLVLTKQAGRMRQFFDWLSAEAGTQPDISDPVGLCITRLQTEAVDLASPPSDRSPIGWPLGNVHVGVTIEDQSAADQRVGLLESIPAAVRWLSVEPLLESVDLGLVDCMGTRRGKIQWVVVGGESGPHARPMNPEWVRDIQCQCQYARAAFFLKQWGEWAPIDQLSPGNSVRAGHRPMHTFADGITVERFGRRITGRLLDGSEYLEYPSAIALPII